MIGIVATLKVKDGMAAEFEAAAMDLVEAVNANEPDCLLYRLYRTEDEHTFVFMERYKDEAAGDFHRNSRLWAPRWAPSWRAGPRYCE